MACFGSRALRHRRLPKPRHPLDARDVPEEEVEDCVSGRHGMAVMKRKDGRKVTGSGGGGGKKKMNKEEDKRFNKKNKKKRKGMGDDDAAGRKFEKNPDVLTHTKHQSFLRKKVDPETAKYFLEIANLLESNTIEIEELPSVCANALDEARGKEVELATDMVISHTLQTLIEACELEQVCVFLQGCASSFSSIAMDRYGSHVVETALKSLSLHLQDMESLSVIEDILTIICKVVTIDPVNMMCNCYGSHVVRSLLCLCKGVPLNSMEELHSIKTPKVLADRLNIKSSRHGGDKLLGQHDGFPDLLKQFVLEMLKHAGSEVKTVRVDKYGSFVLQVALKSLLGYDYELTHAILLLFGCSEENGLSLKSENSEEILGLLKDAAASHIVEVILEVAPDNLYEEILEKIFRGHLFEISSHYCGNFAIQALISSTRNKNQVDLIWEEIGLKMKELLEGGKAGVVASLLASCHRLETHRRECCKVLADAVHSENKDSGSVIPRLLFLDSFLRCREKSTWQWPVDCKMHVLGCLMLQTVFKFSSQYMQLYAKALVSLEADQVLKVAEDAGGTRVLESFLCSDASTKAKLKVISKLQGHFGELSLHPSGSFTVEKCFAASNLYFRETIIKELSARKDELSKTKHGLHIIKNLGIDGYIRRPEQWRSSQAAKEAIYQDFQVLFGYQKSQKNLSSPQSASKNREKGNTRLKRSRHQDDGLCGEPHNLPSVGAVSPGAVDLPVDKPRFSNLKQCTKGSLKASRLASKSGHQTKKFISNQGIENCFVRRGKKRKSSSTELADLAGKKALSSGDVRKLFDSSTVNTKRKLN